MELKEERGLTPVTWDGKTEMLPTLPSQSATGAIKQRLFDLTLSQLDASSTATSATKMNILLHRLNFPTARLSARGHLIKLYDPGESGDREVAFLNNPAMEFHDVRILDKTGKEMDL